MRNPTIVNASTTHTLISRIRSLIASPAFWRMTASRLAAVVTTCFLNHTYSTMNSAPVEMAPTGATLSTKSTNPMSPAAATMMFGGSAMTVETPPILEANTCASRKGMGLTFRVRHTDSVTGIVSTTTVTLSKSAEATAVNPAIRQSVRKPLPPAS